MGFGMGFTAGTNYMSNGNGGGRGGLILGTTKSVDI